MNTFCNKCGKKLEQDNKFCKFCGQSVEKSNPVEIKQKIENMEQEQFLNENEQHSLQAHDSKDKLVLPISILLGCIILGGFFYISQLSKQQSIEKQQQIELQVKAAADKAKADQESIATMKENMETLQRASCVTEAEQSAAAQYKELCASNPLLNCEEGSYLVGNYDNYYSKCLQRKGLK